MQVRRGRVSGQGMVIGNEEIAVILMLHLQKIADRTEIVSQVKIACTPDAADDGFFHKGTKIENCRAPAGRAEFVSEGDSVPGPCFFLRAISRSRRVQEIVVNSGSDSLRSCGTETSKRGS